MRIFTRRGWPAKPARETNDEKELLRGSLVFAVGALDAFLSDLILEIVPRHGPKSSDLSDALKAIAKSDPGLALRVSLAKNSNDSQTEFRNALDGWLSTKSFHGPEKVVQALGYVACPIGWDAFDAETGVDTAKELTRITDERHSIVHRGKRPYIRRDLAESANSLVATIATLVDMEACKRY